MTNDNAEFRDAIASKNAKNRAFFSFYWVIKVLIQKNIQI